jgi:hypothetical protein
VPDEPRVDDRVEPPDANRCCFLSASAGGIGQIYRCAAIGTVEVLVPLKTLRNAFYGDGTRGLYCRSHAWKLVDNYGGRVDDGLRSDRD